MRAQDRRPGPGSERATTVRTVRTASSPASGAVRRTAAGEAERHTPEATAFLRRTVGDAAFPAVMAGAEQRGHGPGHGHTLHTGTSAPASAGSVGARA
ncbi:hypothetical protein [Streptomyces sp. NPDC048612]|uniref:hypothetical protein n=1 Tax=Streptomyces sp. NPDC048612 TaxID=3365579 RepID=UPI00371E9B11